MLKLTKTFYKNADAYCESKYKYIINQGGSSSGKTFSILQILTQIALNNNTEIDICGESLPHLKRGVLRDLPKVFHQFGLNFDLMYNKSDHYIKFKSGGKINLIALDEPGKARGSRRDILFINEANLIPYETALQLFIRTHGQIFIDYNPTNAFWVHKQIIPNHPDKNILIKSTYKDNQFLSASEVAELESHRGDGNNNFWRVFGLGELGVAEGLVFENIVIKEISDEEIKTFDNIRQGIDWGYAADPFVFVKLHYSAKYKKIYIFDEIYQNGLLNAAAIEQVNAKRTPYADIIADSEDPKSIGEFWDAGINIYGAKKGAGSRGYGFKFLQGLNEIIIDPNRCPNAAREFLNAEYPKDKDGERKNEYPDKDDHTIDGVRYSLENDMPAGIKY